MIGGLWKSTSAVAMFAAAGLFVGGLGVPSAMAADLGGDCCADLEERVAELEATTARKGNRRVSLTITGAVTTQLMYWNDGNNTEGSDLYVVDNVAGGGTNVNFTGSARINPNLTAGFFIGVSFFSGSRSHQVTQLDDDATGGASSGTDVAPVIHLANWYLDHKSLGRITVGRANTATAGATTVDLGGAGVIANASFGYWQRGMFLADNDVLQAGTWNDIMGGGTVNGSSLSRGNVVHYSSPTVGGFGLQAAWGEDNVWDIALRYAGEFSGFRVAGAVGYINNGSGLNEVTKDHAVGPEPGVWKGSASVLHVPSGLYLTGAYLNQDNDIAGKDDTTMWYLQGGIAKNWTGLGNTVIYGEYAEVNNGADGANGANFGGLQPCPILGINFCFSTVVDSRATLWGIGIVQHVDAAAMELYLSYRRFSAEATTLDTFIIFDSLNNQSLNDMDVVVAGARIRF
jgi:hypothetical protein